MNVRQPCSLIRFVQLLLWCNDLSKTKTTMNTASPKLASCTDMDTPPGTCKRP
jgi:hypothetical protein